MDVSSTRMLSMVCLASLDGSCMENDLHDCIRGMHLKQWIYA